jgi:hypothetical protein
LSLRGAERRRNLDRAGAEDKRAMLTKDLLFGMNIVSLAGFVVMFLALNLTRRPGVAKIWSIALMGAGTALLLAGLYLHTPTG